VAWGIQSGGVSGSIVFNRLFPTVAIFIVVIQQDDFAKTLLHPEVLEYYTWNTSRKVFCKRQQGARVTGYDDIRATDALGRNTCSYHGFLLYQAICLDFKRLQYPVRLSFAMSINRAQGQSLSVAGVNLESSCFSHGQLYVACS
jgi:hypothetical protein